MSDLYEERLKSRSNVSQDVPTNPKKNGNGMKKIVGIVALALIVTSVGNYGVGVYKEKAAIKKEIAEANALMQKEKEENDARQERVANNKVAYLTFDDGPNYNTTKILEVLKENNIKATFFLVGNMIENNPKIVKDIKDDGHTIGNHTYSHSYNYKSKEAFLGEIEKTDALISEAIGEEFKSYFVRVPGGSMGKSMLKEALKENGYKSINWTALVGDDEKGGKVSTNYVINRAKETTGDDKYEVILAHSTKSVTAEALQKIIDNLKEDGYIFEPLVEDSPVEF